MWTRVNDIDRMVGAMDLFRSRMNRLFSNYDRFSDQGYGWHLADGTPRTNFYDTGSQFEIRAEVPGLTKDDLNIKIQGNYLEVSGTRKPDAPEGYKAHRVERSAASFTRSFTLPSEVDAEKIEASLNEGILSLTLPKAEAAKPKLVTIH